MVGPAFAARLLRVAEDQHDLIGRGRDFDGCGDELAILGRIRQLHIIGPPIIILRDAHALRVNDGLPIANLGANAFECRYGLTRAVRVAAETRHRSVRADDCQSSTRGHAEWQRAVVLQEHRGAPRGVQRDSPRPRRARERPAAAACAEGCSNSRRLWLKMRRTAVSIHARHSAGAPFTSVR